MAIPYPSSPTVGQTFTYGGITYTWNGVAWTYTQTNTPAVVGSVAVTAPITNTGTPTAPVIGINQSALSIAQSQVTNLVSDLAGKANLVGGNSFTDAQVIGTNGTANIGLVVIGTASQAANLQEWRISTGGTVARVDKNGAVSAQYFGPSAAGLLGYLDWTTNSPIFNTGGTGVVGLVVKGVASQSANLQEWQTSTGSTAIRVASNGLLSTSLSPAFGGLQSTSGLGAYFAMNNDTGGIVTYTNGSANKGLVVRGASGQAVNLQEWQNSGGTVLARIAQTGQFLAPSIVGSAFQITSGGIFSNGATSAPANIQAYFLTTSATNAGLVVRGAVSQSANLQEWQTSAGSTAVSIASTGALIINTGNITAFQINQNSGGRTFALGGTGLINSSTFTNGTTAWAGLASGEFNTTVSTRVGIMIRGVASQSANLQEWQTSAGSTALAVNSAGLINATRAVTVTQTNTGEYYLRLAGVASQTGDFLQVNDSSANPLFRVASTGAVTAGGTARLGQVTVIPASTATVGVVVQGLLNQSADLQQWQTSTGSTAAYLGSGGAFRAAVLQTSSAAVDARLRNAGGEITFAKATAVSTNPGAGYGKIYFRDGTLAGTLRFVSITGASGVEETLIDNISSGTAVASAQFTGAGGVNTAGSVISSAGFSLSGTVAPILLNGSAGTSGQVLTSGGAGTTPTWTTVGGGGGSFTGGTLTSDLVLAAGSTAVEPLTFQANTSTVGTVSGAMEYDGTVFYQTSNTNPGKALATQNYYYVSNSDYGPDFTVNSTAKSLLGGSTVGLTVAAGTTYEYELITAISHQFVTTASISGDYLIVSTTVSGSPVVSTTHQVDYGSNTTGFTTATTLSTVRPTGNVTFMPAITSGTRYAFLRAKGLIRVTGTGTVKIYPAIQTSGASGSGDNIWNVRSGTIFKLTPVGNGTVTQVGAFA